MRGGETSILLLTKTFASKEVSLFKAYISSFVMESPQKCRSKPSGARYFSHFDFVQHE